MITCKLPSLRRRLKLQFLVAILKGPQALMAFLFFFIRSFGTLLRGILGIFHDFQRGNVDLRRLNFSMITLIPKDNEARVMKKFRPISLLNCSFKIFSK